MELPLSPQDRQGSNPASPPLPSPLSPSPSRHRRPGAVRWFPPALRLVLAALAAALLLGAPEVATGQGSGQDRSGQTPADGEPRVQGLPPAPPPSGIRPSRPRGEPAPRRGPAPRRATTEALGRPLAVEVRDLPQEQADATLRAAVEAVREVEALLDPEGDPSGTGVAALNAAGGGPPVVVDPRLVEVLERSLSFCRWSDQAHGPLGGELYRLWGLRSPTAGRPTPGRLEEAARSAACDRVAVERGGPPAATGPAPEGESTAGESTAGDGASPPRAQLAGGSRVDLWGFALGFAVDRALETLEELGVENGYVELGPVRRALGPGPDGRGWPVVLPVFPSQPRPLDRIWLQDEALAVSSAVHRPLLVGGDRHAPYVDQRSGTPAEGVVGVVVVTELAVDAEALSASLMVLGNREGLLRVGGLEPSPHVLWLLGGSSGAPVLSQYNWTEVSLR